MRAYVMHNRLLRLTLWPFPPRQDRFADGGGRSDRARLQGSFRQGLTENTRVPWEAPQGTLVPCVTHHGELVA